MLKWVKRVGEINGINDKWKNSIKQQAWVLLFSPEMFLKYSKNFKLNFFKWDKNHAVHFMFSTILMFSLNSKLHQPDLF